MAKVSKKNPKGAGRKRIEINWDLVESLAPLSAELNYIAERTLVAEGLPVDKKTIEMRRQLVSKRIKERYGCDYTTFRNERMEQVRAKLINKAFNMAFGGNVEMLKLCLKNLCGWTDRKEFIKSDHSTKPDIILKYSLPDKIISD